MSKSKNQTPTKTLSEKDMDNLIFNKPFYFSSRAVSLKYSFVLFHKSLRRCLAPFDSCNNSFSSYTVLLHRYLESIFLMKTAVQLKLLVKDQVPTTSM